MEPDTLFLLYVYLNEQVRRKLKVDMLILMTKRITLGSILSVAAVVVRVNI